MTRIAIIGAGLAGLSLARLLEDKADITIYEKARGVSGRMSTRRADPYQFDHGAQYFTIRDKAFHDFLQPLFEKGVIQRWNARYCKFDNTHIIDRQDWAVEEPRYVGVPSMNAIAKALAETLDVHLNTRIVELTHHKAWKLTDEDGYHYDGFDWVVSTAPAPQTAALFPENFQYHNSVRAIHMQGSLALMLGFQTPLPLDFDAAHIMNADISWIAVNNSKPQRRDHSTMIVHSSAAYADMHIDDDREAVIAYLCQETSRIIGYDMDHADHIALHAWRYAKNADKPDGAVFGDADRRLAAFGDWCVGGRVEGAFTSAYALAELIKQTI